MYMHHRHRAGRAGESALFALRIVAVRHFSGLTFVSGRFGVTAALVAVASPQHGERYHAKYASAMGCMANMILLANLYSGNINAAYRRHRLQRCSG
jgi:hypothetical protein